MGPKVVRTRDAVALNAVCIAVVGVVYVLVGLAARWDWDWGSLATLVTVIILIPVEWSRYSGRKALLPSDAVVVKRPLVVRDLLLWVVFGAVLLLFGAMSHRLSVGSAFAVLLYAIALGFTARRLELREERTASVMFTTTLFWSWWDKGIWETRGIGWYPDPSGRHQWRLWDGSWRSSVADHGVLSEDHPERLPATPWT
jgi:hypothetical protein